MHGDDRVKQPNTFQIAMRRASQGLPKSVEVRMISDILSVTREGAVATVTLRRPDLGNALDIPLSKALLDASIECDEDASIRCVVLTGEGRHFCVGGDVAAFSGAGDQVGRLTKEITAYLHMAISRFARMEKPLITAINGPAAGAGLSLAVLGDIALAKPSAHFTVAYTAIGLTADAGMTYLLPRLIGLRKTQELMLTNARLTAEEAAAIGLITRVIEEIQWEEEVSKVASELSRSATKALGQTRRLLLQTYGDSFEGQMEAEARTIAEAAQSANGREGVAAFVAKRKPEFL